MNSRHNLVFLRTGPLIAVNGLLVAVVDLDGHDSFPDAIFLGFLFGTLFAHTTLAAAWTAFGPGPLIWRLPCSLIWVALLAVALAINISLHRGPSIEAVVVIGLCLLVQWTLLQFPLWGLVIVFGLHLRHMDEARSGFDPRERQFGIRQLIIVTTIVGAALGLGRLVVTRFGQPLSLSSRDAPIFFFLGVAAVALTLPLILAVLMRRLTLLGTLLVLVLIGVMTAWELPLLRALHSGPGPQTEDFIAINAFTALIVLMVLAAVRMSGYSLTTIQKTSA
jgi:hypothetical protein